VTRYDKTHTQRTRASIVEAASRAFRSQGIDQVGVGDVMAGAGLTHGGFYAHFAGKEELVGEACAHALVEAAERRFGPAAEDNPPLTLPAYIRSYLSRSHRDDPATGCVIAALAADLARRSPETRHALTDAVQTYVDGLSTLLPEDAPEDAAWALLAGLAGTVMLARAVDDPALSDRILRAGRALYAEALHSPPPETST
jgi:TetR/AcrR family transcriptional repressor of nem operon